jgi:DNA-binding CsgD family transcriptional regulator
VAVQKIQARRKPRPQPAPGTDLGRITKGLSDLDPIGRKAMRLSAEGKTGSEIAATLNLSENQVKHALREARKHLAGVH